MYRLIMAGFLLAFSIDAHSTQCFGVGEKTYQLKKDGHVMFLSLYGSQENQGYLCGSDGQAHLQCQAEDDSGSFELSKEGTIKLSKNHDFGTPDEPRLHQFDDSITYSLKPCP